MILCLVGLNDNQPIVTMPPFSSNPSNIKLAKSPQSTTDDDHHSLITNNNYTNSPSNQLEIVDQDEDDLPMEEDFHKLDTTKSTTIKSYLYIDNSDWSIVWINVIFFIILHAAHFYGIYYLLTVRPYLSWMFCK